MRFIKKITVVLMLCTLLIIPQTGCSDEEPVSENQFLLDTVCTLTVYGMGEADAQAAIDKAFECCRDYENMLSKTVEGSDIYRINHAGGEFVTVEPETRELIEQGMEYGDLSEGMFDITIGAVSELWDFHADHPQVPEAARIEEAVKTVDYKKIQIKGNQVRLENPGARIDLGGIAKGYIADRMTEVMEETGVEHATVNLGGNLVAIGEREEGRPWRIGIELPYSNGSDILGSVDLADKTLVTSGVYERYFEQDGTLYHHVLDPNTGYPIDNSLNAVVILGNKGRSMECDVLGTVCLALGEEKSRKLLSRMEGLQAAFIDKSNEITTFNGMEITPAE